MFPFCNTPCIFDKRTDIFNRLWCSRIRYHINDRCKLARFAYNRPPARMAYAPEGMLEYWALASGSESLQLREKMVSWFIVKFCLTGTQ
jgi:hypothetical protein